MKQLILIALLFSSQAFASHAYILPVRCPSPHSSLTDHQKKEVNRWISICRPEWMMDIMQESVVFVDDSRRLMTPVLGVKRLIEDPSPDSYTRYRLEVSNPENYALPIEAITETRGNTKCDIPEDYQIVGWCR